MLKKLIVALVSSAIAFGTVGSASAAQDPAKSVSSSGAKATSQAPRNAAPLLPGGAAGVKQAQGSSSNDWILVGGGIVLSAGILVLVAGGGNDDSNPSTGTN